MNKVMPTGYAIKKLRDSAPSHSFYSKVSQSQQRLLIFFPAFYSNIINTHRTKSTDKCACQTSIGN